MPEIISRVVVHERNNMQQHSPKAPRKQACARAIGKYTGCKDYIRCWGYKCKGWKPRMGGTNN